MTCDHHISNVTDLYPKHTKGMSFPQGRDRPKILLQTAPMITAFVPCSMIIVARFEWEVWALESEELPVVSDSPQSK